MAFRKRKEVEMSEKRFTGRVGLFVFIGIVLIGALMLNFSRGIGLFKPKYELHMRVRNVAGLKPRSAVFLSGLQIGNVKSVEFDHKNKGVIVHLKILETFPLHQDAKFVIEQLGVLGDQFVNISPGSPDAPLLKEGDEVNGAEPFNLQEVAQSANVLLKRFDDLGATVGEAIARVNSQVLDAQSLSNFSLTLANFEKVSERTMALVDNASVMITNNAPVFSATLSNLLLFSRKLEKVAMQVDETIVTNRVELNESMKNLRDATASLKHMTGEMDSGKGIVGGLLKDEQLRGQLSLTLSNLSVLSSNLNRFGLLYKPKQPKNLAAPTYTGKSEFKK
jgi:phospholipid/cholesterol/gamma-HCH transport system substrate-binding protein